MASELWFWGDVGKDGEDQLVWELENCENGMRWIDVRSEGATQELVLRLVWSVGDRPMAGRRLLRRPDASLEKYVGEFSLRGVMIL